MPARARESLSCHRSGVVPVPRPEASQAVGLEDYRHRLGFSGPHRHRPAIWPCANLLPAGKVIAPGAGTMPFRGNSRRSCSLTLASALPHRLRGSRQTVFVKSFGRRLAYESPRGTNPRCVARGLWGFDELRVVRVTGVVFTRLPRTVAAAVLPADQVTAAMPRVGQIGDDVWDRRD
jgi:hypothetical protein